MKERKGQSGRGQPDGSNAAQQQIQSMAILIDSERTTEAP